MQNDERILEKSPSSKSLNGSFYSEAGHSSRSVQRHPTDLNDQFGLQKRRLVESFEGLTLLSHNQYTLMNNKKQSPGKRQLIQVLNSVEFEASESEADYQGELQGDDADRSHSATDSPAKVVSVRSGYYKSGEQSNSVKQDSIIYEHDGMSDGSSSNEGL